MTELNYRDYFFVIPENSPFFVKGLVVRLITQTETRKLTENVDYYLVLPYEAATRAIGIPVYGGIALNDKIVNGTISIDYQTIGGEWVSARTSAISVLFEMAYNPRTTYWDTVTNKQATFPPINHSLDIDDTYGTSELIESINRLAEIIQKNQGSVSVVNHIVDMNNPHNLTKEQIGLSQVANYPPATIAEAIEGVSGSTLVTPMGLAAAISNAINTKVVELLTKQGTSYFEFTASSVKQISDDMTTIVEDAMLQYRQRLDSDIKSILQRLTALESK
jgi:hypothetical protein